MQHSELLFLTARKIFEDSTFAFVDPPHDDSPPDLADGSWEAYEIGFKGPFSGSLSMVLEVPLSSVLSANMLGVENDDPEVEEKRNDAMGEILNIICGNILPYIAGNEAEFSLQSPAAVPVEAYCGTRFQNQGFAALSVEDLRAEINLKIEGPDGNS